MELLLLALLLGALLFTIILLFQMQRSLRERDAYEAEVARQNAEQLRSSLDQKVTLSMSVVSDRLQQVSRSLGTLQSLSQNVGDLKKVMGNVKNRGIWGEMQLARLLSDMLAPDQYGTNVAIRPRSQERVEFAICLPGKDGKTPVWLPIDAKLPQEDYLRLLEARETDDEDAAQQALKGLAARVSRKPGIFGINILPRRTQRIFGILYLPLEGLFAEVTSVPGLLSELQQKYRVTVAGPTTLAALINSLLMGFRTLMVEKKTSEVWRFVVRIQQDMESFDLAVDRAQKKIDDAASALEAVSQRSKILKDHLARAEKFSNALDKQNERN